MSVYGHSRLGMPDAFDPVRAADYVLLTTFKRDGSGVPTAVWAVSVDTAQGPGIRIWTQKRTGKVKRVRNIARVQVAPCTRMGKPTGETVEATARLLGPTGTRETLEKLKTKYGLLAKFIAKRAERKIDQSIAIEVVLKP